MNILKRLFCKHTYEFVRNIYGDEIRYLGWKRSVWKCSKCGKIKYSEHIKETKRRKTMTPNDIKQIQIIATTNDGKHIMTVSDEKHLILYIATCCKFVKLKDELFEQCSLKELMEE